MAKIGRCVVRMFGIKKRMFENLYGRCSGSYFLDDKRAHKRLLRMKNHNSYFLLMFLKQFVNQSCPKRFIDLINSAVN